MWVSSEPLIIFIIDASLYNTPRKPTQNSEQICRTLLAILKFYFEAHLCLQIIKKATASYFKTYVNYKVEYKDVYSPNFIVLFIT